MAEYLDIYDINRQKTGKKALRWTHYNTDEFISVVHVCIINSKNEMLIQKRASNTVSYENMWDLTCGGATSSGETSALSAERELFEEVGIKYSFENIRPKFTINFKHGFQDFYVINMDVDLNDVKLQVEEVADAKFATIDEIFKKIDNGEFIPYYKSLIQFIFDSKDNLGSHFK